MVKWAYLRGGGLIRGPCFVLAKKVGLSTAGREGAYTRRNTVCNKKYRLNSLLPKQSPILNTDTIMKA